MIVEQVLARISADTSGLQRGVRESNTLLASLHRQGQQSSRATAQGFHTMETSLYQVQRAASSVKSTFMGYVAATGAINLVTSAIQAAKSALIDFNSTIEQATIGFTTMLGSAGEANKFIKELKEFAVRTPFEFSQLITASQRLMALGFSAEKVQPMLAAVGDAVAALGGTMQESGQRVIRALGQMQAKGKVSAEEMMQLSEAGISAWQYLADAYGVTTAEMMERSKKTAVDSGKAIQAIMAGMSNDFGGMMEAQSKTLQGAMSNIVDYAEQTAGAMTMPLYEAMRDGVLKIATIAGSAEFERASQRVANQFGDALESAFAKTGALMNQARPFADVFTSNIGMQSDDIAAVGRSLAEIAESLAVATASALEFGAALVAASPGLVVSALKAMTTAFEVLTSLLETLAPLAKVVMSYFVAKRIMGFVQAQGVAIAQMRSQIGAHLGLAQAINAEAAARNRLAYSSSASAAAAIGFKGGVVPGLASINAGMKASAGRAIGLKAALAGVTGAFNPMMLAIMAATGVMASFSASAAHMNVALDEWAGGITEGAETAREKIEALNKEMQKTDLPTNRDLQYSGGFGSDLAAAVKNTFSVWDWFDEQADGGNASNRAMEKLLDERNEITEDYAKEQRELLRQYRSDFDDWVNGLDMDMADAADKAAEQFEELKAAQAAGFNSLLDPMREFADKEGITLEEMMNNMYSNLESLQAWKENLGYLLEEGQGQLAAYFASLGPDSLQAMSELIQGGTSQMDAFRMLLVDGFEEAGLDASEQMWAGLELIPGLADEYGYDVAKQLTEAAEEEMRRRAQTMPNAFKESWEQIKEDAEAAITSLFGEEALTPETSDLIDSLVEELDKLDPEALFGAGITPEMLGLPTVLAALGELSAAGGDLEDPLELALTVEAALLEIGRTEEEINKLRELISPPGLELDLDTTDARERIREIRQMIDDLPTEKNLTVRTTLVRNSARTAGRVIGEDRAYLDALGIRNADGNYLPKSATIHRGSTLYQWGEPETGGEAFIPLSPSKRGRSTQIWAEVGKQLGVLSSYADGKPEPWFWKPYRGGTEEAPSGGGGSTGTRPTAVAAAGKAAVDPGILYEFGEISAQKYLAMLRETLASLDQFSDDWAQKMREITRVESDIGRIKRADIDYRYGSGSLSDNYSYLQFLGGAAKAAPGTEEWFREQGEIRGMEQTIKQQEASYLYNRWSYGNMDTDEYTQFLERQIRGLSKYSDEWVAVQQEIDNFNAMLEDNKYEFGAIGKDEYLTILEERLAMTQEFSNEWVNLQNRIEEVSTSTTSKVDEMLNAYDQFYSTIYGYTDAVGNLSGGATSFDSLLGYYEHMQEGITRWQTGIEKLRGWGMNPDFLNRLILQGPSALPFVESLNQSMVGLINAGEANLNTLTSDFALGNVAAGTVNGGTVTIGDIQISVGEGLTEQQVRDAFDEMLADLIDYIDTGV
jgi:tape measure domain-containing protein